MDPKPPVDPEELIVAKSHLGFPVIGIGASAGGIAALQRLLGQMPADPGMAFVVVMHLSPNHESTLAQILERAGRLPVVAVAGSTALEVNHVYVISPAMRLTMSDGHLRVSALTTMEGRRQSIDLFFRSLAQAHAERAVGIVLSGTGNDGAQGLKRIKERGGVAIAQSPEDAQFDGMPRAAVQTGVVDFVLPVDEMPEKLRILWENARQISLPAPPRNLEVLDATGEAELLAEEALLSIKALLRERTGHDFAHYKRGTVLRRLERRMQVNALPDLPSYRRLLDKEPGETAALLQDMLISVTNFFRDPQAFAALGAAVQASIGERAAGEPFRAWVAGCATGEEAYSVAITLQELLPPTAPPLQLFASDIDRNAVAFARAAVYPASIATDVSAERLHNFFTSDAAGFRVAKSLRDGLVFSSHNVLSDPPFTRMDLICCRNLMIYLDRAAQDQLLNSFHYALRPRGLLFLGSSETADAAENLFEAVDKTHRVYRMRPTAMRTRVHSQMRLGPPALPTLSVRTPAQAAPAVQPLEALHERVIREYAPPTVLVDADDTVLHVSRRAAHLLRLPEGAPTAKLMALTRPELRVELRTALARATQTGKSVEAPRVRLAVNGETHSVVITVRPALMETPKGLMLVIFDEVQESLAVETNLAERDPVVETLETELLRTQQLLRSTVGESAASTEELRASNEELQTINEELRSTTEELETSREELQAVNEELTTVNTELTLRVDEATKANDDWQNLMTSAEIGTVFVDRDMRVKRYTPQAATVFNFRPADIGRPLLDITHCMRYPDLAADVADALRDLKRVEREIVSDDGRWLLARVAPYRTSEDRIDGAVLAFLDVTARRSAETRLHASEQRMALVAQSMRDFAIITLDGQGLVVTWSAGAEKIFGHEAQEVIGKSISIIFTEADRAAGKPAEELRRARETGRATDDRWHVRRDGTRVYCSGITTPLGDGAHAGFAKIARDFTDQELDETTREAALTQERAAAERLKEVSLMKDQFLAVVSHELKNPLSVIQMNAHLISRLPRSAADPQTARSARAIMTAVASQVQIIDDLLELSRANIGKIALSPALLDMGELVRDICAAVRTDVAAKGQTLTTRIQRAQLFGDRVRVEQIVWNLVTNAVKFTPEGGRIRVELDTEDGYAKFTVEDDGIGLDAAHLTNIFEMFKQIETGANRTRTGLGIGLALVKQLAELHGGRVAASSDGVGRGSRFCAWLPLAGTDVPKPPAAEEERGLRGVRLLVVDDEPDQLAALAALLETEGALVERAGDAERALQLARGQRFDAVVSDIAMPGKDGLWLAGQLREGGAANTLPLIAVSGMGRGVDRVRALAAGFGALVSKPIDLDELRREILRGTAEGTAPSDAGR